MSDNPVLLAEERSEFGKGAARRARRAGKVPTVLYGHGEEPRHLDVPGHDLFLIVRGNKNALVELKIDGKSQLALVKDVQVHPVRRDILHADFQAVKAGEKVDVEVSIDGIEAGSAVHVSDLKLPAGVEVELDAETVILSVQETAAEEEEEAAEAPAEGDAE